MLISTLNSKGIDSLWQFNTKQYLTLGLLVLLFHCFGAVRAHEGELDTPPKVPHSIIDTIIGSEISNSRECFPINAKSSVPGGQDAYIELTYTDETPGILAVAIYNFYDQPLMGAELPNTNEIIYTCTDEAIGYKLCTEHGKILFRNASESTHAEIKSEIIKFTSQQKEIKTRYDVKVTGVYCAIRLTVANVYEYATQIKVFNANGGIPAVLYPKLPFFGVTCIVYTVVFLLWVGKSTLHWKEILPVQKYIAGVIGFLAIETFFNYLYLYYWNSTGEPSSTLLFLSAITNAARISISFFILLIVSMGYGVVKPSLGGDMIKCQILTIIHFIIGAVYAGLNLEDPHKQGFPILLVVVPLAMTMTVFYAWTLTSLTSTTQNLETRRQHFKLQMYQRLWHILLFAGINLIIFFIVQSVWFARSLDMVFMVRWWRWRWIITDGWTNILYTVCMLAICYLWRPTSNNARYGLEQILSDPLEDEFDLDFSELFPNQPKPPKDPNHETVFTLADSEDEYLSDYQRVHRRSRSSSPRPDVVVSIDPKLQ